MKAKISLGREIKVFLLFLTLVSFTFNFYAQDGVECATPDPTGPFPVITYPENLDASYFENLDAIVLNVFFWGINQDDGSSSNRLTEEDSLHAIAQLNIQYNQFNIFFKYYGTGHINSSQFYTIENCTETQPPYTTSCLNGSFPYFLHTNPQYEKTDAINVYVPRSTVGFAGYGLDVETRAIFNSYSFESDNPGLLNHEMGHVLGLTHTFLGWKNEYNPPSDCEHVTRDVNDIDDPNDPNDTFYNALDKGDRIDGTAAVPDFRYEKCIELGYTEGNCPDTVPRNHYISDFPVCEYDNENGMDCQGQPYEIFTEDVRNVMGYTHSLCGQDFTLDQGVYMRAHIDDHPNWYNDVTNILGVEALYQPYKGVYSTSGNTPLNPGLEPPTFQPGFTYVFKTCGPFGDYPPPPDYYDTSFFVIVNGATYTFSKDIARAFYDDIIHYNHYAIVIEEIEDTQAARCCYSVVGSGFDDGAIVKFNDGVFNTNVTITPQDSTQINNPNLINQLEPGLYNIQQNYNGATQETTIIKENN